MHENNLLSLTDSGQSLSAAAGPAHTQRAQVRPAAADRLQAAVPKTSRLLAEGRREKNKSINKKIVQNRTVVFAALISSDVITDQGCAGATCRLVMLLQPAPRAQRTSWPMGSDQLLQGGGRTSVSQTNIHIGGDETRGFGGFFFFFYR